MHLWYAILALLPMTICLFWTIEGILKGRRRTTADTILTVFAFVCTLLYLCHGHHFLVGSMDDFGLLDCLYLFCTVASYPLFSMYVKALSSIKPLRWADSWVIVPAVVVGVWGVATLVTGASHAPVVLASKLVSGAEILLVAWFGTKALIQFDKEVADYYSDPEQRSLASVKVLLLLFGATSVAALVSNILGRDTFLGSDTLAVPSLIFSSLLFGIFHVGFGLGFSAETMREDLEQSPVPADPGPVAGSSSDLSPMKALFDRISDTMVSEKLFMQKGLRISDVAMAVGSNRSYVSTAINTFAGKPFSDYVNEIRVGYVQQELLAYALAHPEEPLTEGSIPELAFQAGFAATSSFYRSFRKYTGKTPTEWINEEVASRR